MTKEIKQAFEKWASESGFDIASGNNRVYRSETTDSAYGGFSAAVTMMQGAEKDSCKDCTHCEIHTGGKLRSYDSECFSCCYYFGSRFEARTP